MRPRSISLLLAAAALAGPAVAGAQSPSPLTTLDHVVRPTAVAADGGWAAWSRYDGQTKRYSLVTRDPAGRVVVQPLSPQRVPFVLDLGPRAGGGEQAVWAYGGKLYTYALGVPGAHVFNRLLPGGGLAGEPSIWKNTIAFLRLRPHGGKRHPFDLFSWKIGTDHLHAFTLPQNHYSAAERKQFSDLRKTEGETGLISQLDLHGSQVVYNRVADVASGVATSDLWVQRAGGAPRLIDRVGTGGTATGLRTFVSPSIDGDWVYAYQQFADLGNNFVRYRLSANTADVATGVPFGDNPNEPLLTAAHDGDGVIWSVEDVDSEKLGNPKSVEIRTLAPVTWAPVKRHHPAALGL